MKGYKTIAFNVLMAAIAVVHSANSDAQLPDAAAVQGAVDNFQVWFDGAVILGNLVLRAVTTSAIFKKE